MEPWFNAIGSLGIGAVITLGTGFFLWKVTGWIGTEMFIPFRDKIIALAVELGAELKSMLIETRKSIGEVRDSIGEMRESIVDMRSSVKDLSDNLAQQRQLCQSHVQSIQEIGKKIDGHK